MVLFNTTKEETLINLWKGTKTIGMGFIHSHTEPTKEDTKYHFTKYGDYIDYFFGRPIKTDFTTFPDLQPNGYNTYAGNKMMEKISQNEGSYFSKTKKLNEDELVQLKKDCPFTIM